MYVIYFRAGGHYRADLDFDADPQFWSHLTNHESVWLIPGTLTAEDFD